ncbi:dihydrolipoyl dehydrogenase [Aquihabitans sp. G128]|uniref:dihydrolipoyl dehydrogenase n=1 Tax=Aquihabitans sp. G128 TaxID=2849779 RepID=UPI001C21AFC2|nr:dihydrolipoyl dehydrogenase [Aquihabitans sp. G128]QXC61334.1 dihydrolipoyl dehydrogenase [Aquihabitans sp. G128]
MSDDAAPATHFDVIVIGGGPAGYGAALYGSAAGLNIAVVEKDKVGGTCLHRGCIPAKELLETAHVYRTVSEASKFGIESSAPTIEFGTTMERKNTVVDTLFKGLSGLLKNRKVTVFAGTGTLRADRGVHVVGNDGETADITADAVILAAGSVPRSIPGFDVDGKVVLTSDEVFELTELPKKVAVIGGGAIGCEFASMLSDLGSEVTILEALPQILPGVDKDVVNTVLRSFKGRKLDVKTGVKVAGHSAGSSGTTVHVEGGDDLEVDAVVVSVGRRPLSDSLGLDGTGVTVTDRGFVEVDELCRTSVDGVWAVGDLIATPGLAHVGYAEAILVIKQLLGEEAIPVDYGKVAWCIYSKPEVAFVGLSEQAARDAGHDVVVAKHRWGGNSRALIVGDTEGVVKIIAEKREDGTGGQVLGVHMSGPWVTEQLGQAYLGVNWEATVDDIAHFIQPHPSLSETFGEAVLSLTGRSLNG